MKHFCSQQKYILRRRFGPGEFTFAKPVAEPKVIHDPKPQTMTQQCLKQVGDQLMAPVNAGFVRSRVVMHPKRSRDRVRDLVRRKSVFGKRGKRKISIKEPNSAFSKPVFLYINDRDQLTFEYCRSICDS